MTTQGSVGAPYLFNAFLNDLEVLMNATPVLLKYADVSSIVAPIWKDLDMSADLVKQFLSSWSINNQMMWGKCKELIFIKNVSSSTHHQYTPIVLFGLTFHPYCKFSNHIRLKLTKANRCLHILRTLQKGLFSLERKHRSFV